MTPGRLLGAAAVGAPLETAVACGSVSSERCRRLWKTPRTRFSGLFPIAIIAQFGLWAAPTGTLLAMLTGSLAMIATRTLPFALARRDR